MRSYTVVGYAAGIPPNNTNIEKPLILSHYCNGVNATGDKGILHHGFNLLDCDLAIIQGFVHEDGKNLPHLNLRRQVIQKQRLEGKKTLIVDSNLFKYKNTENPLHFLRYSFDGIFPTTGCYFTNSVDPTRWIKIKKQIGIEVKPWRNKGNHILICLQRNGGWSMQGLNVLEWIHSTITNIRKFSSRPIVIRHHPGDKKTKILNKYKNVQISTNENFTDDLINAWATITYNSSPGVASAIEGVPVFVLDPNPFNSQANDIANTDISMIENPKMPERQAWLEKISMSHWNFNELQSGEAWKFMKSYL